MNKENFLELMIRQNLGRQGKLNRMLGERRADSERSHVAFAGDRCQTELYPVSHSHMAIHRLIEMG